MKQDNSRLMAPIRCLSNPIPVWVSRIVWSLVFVGAFSAPSYAQRSASARELASLRADIAVLNENMRKLNAANQALREENRQLAKTVQSLTGTVTQLQKQASRQQQALHDIQRRLEEGEKTRRHLTETLIETVTRKVEELLDERQQPAPSSTGNASSAEPTVAVRGQYTVQRGDTLSAIAAAFDVSVARLKKANSLTDDLIREGQVLNIPSPAE